MTNYLTNLTNVVKCNDIIYFANIGIVTISYKVTYIRCVNTYKISLNDVFHIPEFKRTLLL